MIQSDFDTVRSTGAPRDMAEGSIKLRYQSWTMGRVAVGRVDPVATVEGNLNMGRFCELLD